MINIISTIIVGFVVGLLARFFYPGAVDMGFWLTTLLGIGGSLLAGLVTASRRSGGIGGGFNRAGFFASLLGAIVLILLGRILL
ncbi:GlsB/YeaQ/YmgE family stress response membrane protein [Sphingorhabdus soli]|uniref:GlsB/YeaQ/YmgE family stress response membrane protein n=1 Tax=Flavisphingopyxis soli TaxID=2601267 RepID=A0A5C6UQD5_9SPHN|nr:GlsB/YeaQ/YmgE family stress response membrane protein [Sphingorhabdus soli]TXC73235.1 GlsB/YeaQ/YmgE family stress response membrane protein [Sphingorhabdus soli]